MTEAVQRLTAIRVIGKSNSFMDRWISLIMPCLIGVGILIHMDLTSFVKATPYLFMYLTFVSSLNVNVRNFKELIHQKTSVVTILFLLHMVAPFVAVGVAHLFFHGQQQLIAGFAIIMALPVGVTAIFWVGYSGASVMMALAFVTLDTLISPLVVPVCLHFVLGSTVHVNGEALVLSLLELVVIPSILGIVIGEFLRRSKSSTSVPVLTTASSKLCLYLIVLFNSAVIAGDIHVSALKLVKIIVVVFLLMIMGYLLSLGVVSVLCKNSAYKLAFSYCGGIRNYTVGVVLATGFFSTTTAFPILLAMLLQHPTALLMHYFFKKLVNKQPNTSHGIMQVS